MIFEFEDKNLNDQKVGEIDVYTSSEEDICFDALSQIQIFPFCDMQRSEEERCFFSFNSEDFPSKLKSKDLYGEYILICRELLSDYVEDNFRKVVIDVKYYPRKFLFLVYSICYFKQIDGTLIIEDVEIGDPIFSLLSALNNMEDHLEKWVNDVERVAPNKLNSAGGFYRKKYSSNRLFFNKYKLKDILKTYSTKNSGGYSLFDFSEMLLIESDGEKVEIFDWDIVLGKRNKCKIKFTQIRNMLKIGVPFQLIGKILGNKLYIYDIFSVAGQELKKEKEKADYLEVFNFPTDLAENFLIQSLDLVSDDTEVIGEII